NPYPGKVVRFGLAHDGSRVLATLPLGPGMECEYAGPSSGCRVTGPPVGGPLVVAHDLTTGASVWTLQATAPAPDNRRAADIAGDGRLALVELADGAVGVIRVADGEVLQTIERGGAYLSFGFFQQGRCAFIQVPDRLRFYEVDAGTTTDARCRLPSS